MTFYLPWYAHLGESLRSLDAPGWNPYILSGTPFAGNPQSGWWYLPAMLFFTLFPPVLAFKLSILFHLALSAVAMYALARLLGIGAVGAFAAGAAYAFSQNLGVSTCCTIHLQLAPWLPIALIGIEMGMRQRVTTTRLLWFTITSLALSQMAAAWVGQGAYNGYLIVAAFVVWRCFVYRPKLCGEWSRRVVDSVVAGVWSFGLGLAMAAAGLLPRLDVVNRTYVGSDEYRNTPFPSNYGWEWPQLVEVLTRFRGDWYPYYTGGGILVAALIGLSLIRTRPAIRFFAGLAIVVAILPLRPTPLHEVFYVLPEFRGLHMHDLGRILAVIPLGVAMLCGVGIDYLVSKPRSRFQRILPPAIGVLFLLATLINQQRHWSWMSITTLSASIILIAALLRAFLHNDSNSKRLRYVQMANVVASIAVVGLLIDPAGYVLGQAVIDGSDANRAQAIETTSSNSDRGGAGAFLQERSDSGELFRYFGFVGPDNADFQAHELFAEPWVIPLLINNRAMRLELYDVQGYDPAQLERYLTTFTALNGFPRDYHEALVYRDGVASPLLNMLNVRYVIVPAGDAPFPDGGGALELPPGYTLVFENDAVVVYENPDALPRAWVVHDAQVADQSAALALIAGGAVDPAMTAVLETESPSLAPLPAGEADLVEIETYEPDRVALNVTAGSAGILVLADSFDLGWIVRVDGEEQTLLAVNGVLRGVVVPAGAHVVEFDYQPASLRYGLAISGAAGLIVAALFCVVVVRSRRSVLADQES